MLLEEPISDVTEYLKIGKCSNEAGQNNIVILIPLNLTAFILQVIEDAREEWYKQNQDVEEDLGNTPENQKALLKTQTSKRLEFVAIDLLKEGKQ